MENVKLRPWQQHIYEMLMEPADDRTILWIYDKEGNKGKTFFAKYMMCNHNAFYACPARGTDLLYAYKNEKIILYDIPRSCDEEHVNWGVLEKLKDGIVFSGKYAACHKIRQEAAHICIFSNALPEGDKFSEDRLKIININSSEFQKLISDKTQPRIEQPDEIIEITEITPLTHTYPSNIRVVRPVSPKYI